MNSITITGTLGRDLELRKMPNGDSVGSFSVADSQGREKPTIWWNCQLFGKRADSLAQYLTKGQQVTVVGNITEREWTDKDGNKRKQMDVRVNDIALQGGKREGAAPAPQGKPAAAPAFDGGFDEDAIPF
jgi:single-strand DNA-binding protein